MKDGWGDRDQDEQGQMSKVRQRTDRLVSEEERTRVGRGVMEEGEVKERKT